MPLIVIEGIDGSGKTTHTDLLVKTLKEQGKEVMTLDFPGYSRSPFGKIIGNFLKGEFGNPIEMDPFQTTLLYAGDRHYCKTELCDAIERGVYVVLNRYVPSNLAYGCAKLTMTGRSDERVKLVAYNETLEYEQMGLPRPDVIIFLDATRDITTKLIDMKGRREYLGDEKRDRYEACNELQTVVRQEYLRLAELSPQKEWSVISVNNEAGLKNIDVIQSEILERISLL